MTKLRIIIDKDIPKQPEKCKGCVWGRWCGSKQVCSMPRCIKWWRRL